MEPNDIRKIRHNIGVNRQTFGELIGVSGSAVEHYELGTRNPSKAVVMNIKRIKLMHDKGALRI